MTSTNSPPTPHTPEAATFRSWCDALHQGTGLLKHIWAEKLTVEQLMTLNFPKAYAMKLRNAAETFWKPVRESKIQKLTTAVATEKNLSIDALVGLDEYFRQLSTHPEISNRQALADVVKNAEGNTEAILESAKTAFREHNQRVARRKRRDAAAQGKKFQPPQPRAWGGTTTDLHGDSTLYLRGPADKIARAREVLNRAARRRMRANPDLSLQQAMGLLALDAILGLAHTGDNPGAAHPNSCGPNCTSQSIADGPVAPTVVLPITGYTSIVHGQHGEAIFGLPNGSTMRSIDVIRRGLAAYRRIILMSPDGQPLDVAETRPPKNLAMKIQDQETLEATLRIMPGSLNLGRNQRTASAKQRTAAETMVLRCPWPGCTTPASECHLHHLEAWQNDGPTDIDNLALVCKPHNSRNDDNRSRPKNGHLFMKDWELYYQPPDGGPPVKNTDPISKLSSVAIAKSIPPLDINDLRQ